MGNPTPSAAILVVEDEPAVAEHIVACLRATGYSAVLASSADHVLSRCAESSRPDLVLMDINLHGQFAGIDLAAQVQAQFRIPVVFLTGSSDATTFKRAKTIGPSGYVLKPYDSRELEICIEIALYRDRFARQREAIIEQLRQALATVKVLRGLLPICACCKKVRDDEGYWSHIELYISRHCDTRFSHGMCPPCFERVKRELDSLDPASVLAGH